MKKLILIFLIFLFYCNPSFAGELIGSGQSVASGGAISDDYSSDTSGNYSAVGGGIAISGGYARGLTDFSTNIVYHNTVIGANQQVSLDTEFTDTKVSAVIMRLNSSTSKYYYAFVSATQLVIRHSDGGFVGSPDTGTFTIDTLYTISCTVNSSNFFSCSVTDDNTDELTVSGTDTTSTGTFVGARAAKAGAADDPRWDNLEAEAL